ncbi:MULTISPECIES: cobalt-precorrin 5A hydrolase [unclassified Fusibacter]|uniref:cobalt-precorrin 5A hydrolase n=1 Tax=unclassified Fusibacter TaxID=2624464 RepID=UPI0010128C16|nr:MULTISPECIES: cobalamin biosynthesis protein [unclassified Fusibacter]MCK8060511.1 cobalamin biosynthesis protein [Fusibacter sp. A2]NPE20200.1 hypothetical protein [Fusibacter sp. A1]RXV63410.1 hypothetical protein DWB64_00110 [Fusibacter sp. A1]
MSTENRTVCIVLTAGGVRLAEVLKRSTDCTVVSTKALEGVDRIEPDFKTLVKEAWLNFDHMIFFCSLGIVVRSIAGLMESKFTDPAVLAVDEQGTFCISVLSGHVGGANKLCERVAADLGAVPVVTTATDRKGLASLDMLMLKEGINPKYYRDEIVRVNSELVSGKQVMIFTQDSLTTDGPGFLIRSIGEAKKNSTGIWWHSSAPPEELSHLIWIETPSLTLGFGCKKDKSEDQIRLAVDSFLSENKLHLRQIRNIATIDIKAVEPGLINYAKNEKLIIDVIDRDLIKAMETEFEGSDFVESTIGIRAVAEPCAVLGSRGRLLTTRYAFEGVTLAIGGIK